MLRPSTYPRSCIPRTNSSRYGSLFGVPARMYPTRGVLSGCCARAASGHAATPPSSVMNSRLFIRSLRRRAWRSRSSHSLYYGGRDKVISPPPVALVEGRRREQWCLPGTTDSLGAREAKVLHQVNQVVAQSEIRRHPVDRFYARHFDLRQGSCRRFVRPDRRRLLRMCRKRPCQSKASEQADELASVHSITSSARASSVGGPSRPSALAVLRLITSSYLVGACTGRSAGFSPLRMRSM